jgi:hypothetical protein
MGLLTCLNSNLFFVFSKILLHMFLIYMSWIMECVNCIFSWYCFPSSHDGECNGNLTTNSWMFSTPTFSSLLNISSASFFLNNFISSYFRLCSLFCVFFSVATFYNFSIVLFELMFLQTPKLQKNTQLLTANENNMWWLLCLFLSFNFPLVSFVF